MIKHINIQTHKRTEFVNITRDIQKAVTVSGIKSGVCYVYVSHTTAGITINEGADPDVVTDMLSFLNSTIPHKGSYLHMEGNSDAHIKTSLMGSSEMIIIDEGRLQLGTWQAVFFCEFDGARSRTVMVKIISG